jgi:hypothetical protein
VNSVLAWVEHLKENQELLGFKASNQEPPLGLGLESDLFYIMIQTPQQHELFKEIGTHLICVDGTHNTTHYANCNLYTLLCHDFWGHGVFTRVFPKIL